MQILDLLNLLPPTGKVILLTLVILLSLWVYFDSKKRGLAGWLWAALVLSFPLVLPVYIFVRPKYFIGFCRDCYRILPRDSDQCYFCGEGIPDMGEGVKSTLILAFKRAIFSFLLDICRASNRFMAFCLFFYKRKFLLLNYKLGLLYPWGMCHQIVATEGRWKDIPINTLTYGETLYMSAWKVFSMAKLNKDDVFYDLGSGTGNVVFFCNILYGIEAAGIEAISTFAKNSNKIKEELEFDRVNFIEGNFLDADFSRGTVFFTVSTVFDPLTIKSLGEKFKETAKGTKIITVSHILEVPHLKVIATGRVLFSWGYENVYLHVRI